MTTRIDLDELERVAKAATPGPWDTAAERQRPRAIVRAGSEQIADAAEHVHWTDKQCEANAAFIALANPTTVLALIARVRELEAGLAEACDRWAAWVDDRHTDEPDHPEMVEVGRLRALAKR